MTTDNPHAAFLDEAATYEQKLQALIDEHGWACQNVFPPDGGGPEDSFTYTVGLTRKDLPELWLGTLAPNQASMILNAVARHTVDHGPVEPGTLALEDWSVPFRIHGPCDVDSAEAFLARRMHADLPTEVLIMQVLWPDEAGRFPGEADYDETKFPQRLLPLAD